MDIKIKDPNNTTFVYHPTKGALLVNPDQAECFYQDGWYDHPVTQEELQAKADELEKQIDDAEKVAKAASKPKKEKTNEK